MIEYVNSLFNANFENANYTIASNYPGIAYYNMATAYQELGEYEETLKYYKKAEDIWRKILPEHSMKFMEIHQGIGECLMMSGQYKEAITEYVQALSILNNQMWPRIEITSDIAECYCMLGELADAKAHYIQTLNYLKEWEETEAGMQVHLFLNLCGIENQLENSTESDFYYQMAVRDAQKSGDPELINIVRTYKNQA